MVQDASQYEMLSHYEPDWRNLSPEKWISCHIAV